MLTVLGFILLGLIPIVVYLAKSAKAATPSLQWPGLSTILKFQYQAQPSPRMLGDWEGRHVAVELHNGQVLVTMQLAQPSRLRVEVGAKADMEARAGMVIPDRLQTGDAAFDGRLMIRCSDRQAGASIFEPTLRQRIMDQRVVAAVGVGDKVQWLLPSLQDPDTLEKVLEVMTALAAEMERFPANANA